MHVQFVVFRLKSEASQAAFLALTERMAAWLKEQPGFVAYELYDGNGQWFDRIAWESAEDARAGLANFRATAIACQLSPLVEDGYRSVYGEAVVSV